MLELDEVNFIYVSSYGIWWYVYSYYDSNYVYSVSICMFILEHRRDACNILLELELQLNLSIGTVLLHAAAAVS